MGGSPFLVSPGGGGRGGVGLWVAAGPGLALGAPDVLPELGDPGGSRGGHQQGACDGGQEQGRGEGGKEGKAQEAVVRGVGVWEEEDNGDGGAAEPA